MKSIQRKDFIAAGTVEKTHGTKGELRLGLEQATNLKEWVFLEIQGKPVPFFIQSISGDQSIVKLEGIDTPVQAARFTGMQLLVPARRGKRKTRANDLDVTGFMLVDATLGELGRVEEVEELPQQLLLRTTYEGRELLIPAVEEFIIGINEEEQRIDLELPEGLIEL